MAVATMIMPEVKEIACTCGGFYRTIEWPCGCKSGWQNHKEGCCDPRNNRSLPASNRCGKPGPPRDHMTIEDFDPDFHGG